MLKKNGITQVEFCLFLIFTVLIVNIISNLYSSNPILSNLAFSVTTIFIVPIVMEVFEFNESDNIKKVMLVYIIYMLIVGASLWLSTFKELSLYCMQNKTSAKCNSSSMGLFALYIFVGAMIGAMKLETLIEQKNLKKNIQEKEMDNKRLIEKNLKLQNELDSERNKIYPTTIVFLKIFKITLNKK